MATDDNKTETETINKESEVKTEETVETTNKETQVSGSDKVDALLASLNDKIDELTKTYDKKLADMKEQLDEKTKENEKLKNVNAQILMNTSVSNANKEIDFENTDFEDVDWDKQANQYFGNIDNKIF